MYYLLWALPGKIFAIIIGFIYLRKLPLAYRLILLQVVLAISAELYGRQLAKYSVHNAWVFNIYNLSDLILTGTVAGLLLGKVKYASIAYYLVAIMCIFWSIEVYVYGIHHLASLFFTGSCIVLALLYIWLLYSKLLFTKKILKEPVFWLSISVILYFGCCLPYFGLYNYLIAHEYVIAKKLMNINRVLNFLRYPLIGVCFIIAAKKYDRITQTGN